MTLGLLALKHQSFKDCCCDRRRLQTTWTPMLQATCKGAVLAESCRQLRIKPGKRMSFEVFILLSASNSKKISRLPWRKSTFPLEEEALVACSSDGRNRSGCTRHAAATAGNARDAATCAMLALLSFFYWMLHSFFFLNWKHRSASYKISLYLSYAYWNQTSFTCACIYKLI